MGVNSSTVGLFYSAIQKRSDPNKNVAPQSNRETKSQRCQGIISNVARLSTQRFPPPNNMHIILRMHILITQILPHLTEQNLHLIQ